MHRLHNRVGKAFAPGRENEHVSETIGIPEILFFQIAPKGDMLFQTALSDHGAESFSGGPVAHEDELEFDPLRDDCRRFDELKKALLSN